jgi:hypothetical protein
VPAAALAVATSALLAGFPPSGSYTVTLAARDLTEAGASAREADWTRGTWKLTLAGRRWTLRQTNGVYGNAVDRGVVATDGARAAFTLTSANGFPHTEFVGAVRWRASAAGLRFTPAVRPRNGDIVALLVAHRWRRAP